MTFSRSTSATPVLLRSGSAVSRYWLAACVVEAISDLLAEKLRARVPRAAAAINAIAPRPPYLAITARLSADLSYETQPDSANMTPVRRSCRKKLLPVPERWAREAL